jgi:hypothetical protein
LRQVPVYIDTCFPASIPLSWLSMRSISICWLASLLLLTGCGSDGPEVASVEGTVTMDGNPLPEASVLFLNQTGRPAAAWTDKNGKYRLAFDEHRSGAIPGASTVRITTARDGADGYPGRKESVPADYNTRTTLKFNVEPNKKNIANFDLKSTGKVDRAAGDDSGSK